MSEPVERFDEFGFSIDPYNEVVLGLAQASTDLSPRELFTDGFDAMFDLCGRDRRAGVEGELYEFHLIDDVPYFDQAEEFDRLATSAAALVLADKRVVVACMQGRNRSGLLVARTLIELGHQPQEAIALVREARGPHALSNRHFVRWLILDCTPRAIASRRTAG